MRPTGPQGKTPRDFTTPHHISCTKADKNTQICAVFHTRGGRGLECFRAPGPQARPTRDLTFRLSSVATAESGTASATVPRRTSKRSTRMVVRQLAGVLCPKGIWSRAMSCLLKRLPWRQMSLAHWRWRTDFQWWCLAEARRARLVALCATPSADLNDLRRRVALEHG